jgi:hypothetical protein
MLNLFQHPSKICRARRRFDGSRNMFGMTNDGVMMAEGFLGAADREPKM